MVGVSAFAKKYGVSENTVRIWCQKGLIEAEQDGKGKPWRISEDAVPPTKKTRNRNKVFDQATTDC